MTALLERFPTSESLFAWLKTPDGGNLSVRTEWMTAEEPLVLIYYTKDTSDFTKPHVPYFRSVVWDARTNKPICFGPARGADIKEDNGTVAVTGVRDFIDGVMVNMFYYNDGWHLATRHNLGATNKFYSKNKTFGDLFRETFDATGLSLDSLDRSATYSWVLQHPDERIVVPCARSVYLVSTTATSVPTNVLHPQDHTDCHTLDDVRKRVATWGAQMGLHWQGLVAYGPDGTRYRMRSKQYAEARVLRGNQAKRPFLWLERWSDGRLGNYLRVYPEEQIDADATIEAFKACTKELYDMYARVYTARDLELTAAPRKYRNLLYKARKERCGAYFPSLRDFMNRQDTALKLWLVNYEVRYAAA